MQDIRLSTPGDIARQALAGFGLVAAAASVVAIVESYSNLLAFTLDHGLSGWRAAIAPLAVDSFIVMGELLLFAAILLHWGKVPHALGAGMAVWGFALSVGGNVWHAASATPVDRAVAAIWPVTATAGLAGALIIVRQIMKAPGAAAVHRGRGTGTPPAPDREEPRRVEASRVRPEGPPGPAAAIDEQALLAELTKLLAAGQRPAFATWAREKTGNSRSLKAKRVYDKALAQMNGGSRDLSAAA